MAVHLSKTLDKIIISVDAMGGDYGTIVTVPAAFKLLARHDNVELILVGNEGLLRKAVVDQNNTDLSKRIFIQHAGEEVMMDEAPAKALRGKKDSSMRVAINLVKDRIAHACISAGNTGALVATARFVLKTLPGISRPAICTHFPTMIEGKSTVILDLGASVDSAEDYLLQLAVMGSILSSMLENIAKPKVALLNIGSEEIKGNEQIRKAAQMLADNKNINYAGFVEGNDIFKGMVDVIVCDGFTGNVMLKTIEGVLNLVKFYAKTNIKRSWVARIMAILAFPMFLRLQRKADPDRYNGATLVGLRGIVVKSHGGAKVDSFVSALEKAVIEARINMPQKISDELEKIMGRKGIEQ